MRQPEARQAPPPRSACGSSYSSLAPGVPRACSSAIALRQDSLAGQAAGATIMRKCALRSGGDEVRRRLSRGPGENVGDDLLAGAAAALERGAAEMGQGEDVGQCRKQRIDSGLARVDVKPG